MSGARHWRILRRELVPNIAVPLASYLLFIAGVAVLAEGLLSFLGLGVPADKASWGRLVQAGRDNLRDAWWWSLCPAGVIFLTILSLNVLQDRVQARWLGIRRQPKQHPRTGVEVAAPVLTARLLVAHSGRPPVLELVNMYTYLPTPLGMVRAVDGVSLRIEEGRMLAVVGESGAGKSMLAKSILGIAPANAFQRGESRLDGVDLRSLDSRALREQRGRVVGTVLQDPATSLDPVMRIGWQVAEPARVHLGLSRSQARDHAIALLRSVGIPEAERRFRQYPHELSGGQLQRVAIAIALSCSPRLLIADEPTSSLDVIVQRQILDLLDELRRTRRLAVLLITHDLAVATSRAEHVAVMYAGRIVETASAASLANRRAMPYTAGLFDAAPRLATTAHQRLLAIPGRAPGSDGSPHGCAFAPRCTVASEKCVADAPVLGLDDGGEAHRWACWHPILGAELSVSS